MEEVLLIEDDKTLEVAYSLNLNMYVGVKVIPKTNHREGIELLKSNDVIKVIIVKSSIDDDKTALEIYKYLSTEEKQIPLIVLGEEPLLEKFAKILPKKSEMKHLIKAVASILGITPKDMITKEVPDYYPVPIHFFVSIENLICPVFIRVKTQEGNQFIKRYHENTCISIPEIQSFLKRGIKNLFIPKNFRLKFTNHLTEDLMKKLTNEKLDIDNRIKATSAGMELIKESMGSAGLSDETVDLAKQTLSSMKKLVSSSPKLKDLLNRLLANKASYLYKHSQLITFIAFHAINNLEWGSEEQQEKLAFVALFHDMTLPTDELVMVHNDEELKTAELKDTEKFLITTHATDAAKLIQGFPRAPLGSDIIIKQHHGSMGGMGFPKSFSNNLSPLAIVFIISEEYAHAILTNENEYFDREEILRNLYAKYTKSMYKRVIKSLENLDIA